MRLKQLTGKRVRISHDTKAKQTNTLHGLVITVSRDYLILMDFDKREHPIKRSSINECKRL
jgi:hypothetical protein